MAGSNIILIKAQKLEDYFLTINFLKERNVEYFTYQVPSLRNHDFVIRHLPTNTEPEAIKSALEDLNFKIINVMQLTTSRPTLEEKAAGKVIGEKRPVPVFKITVDHLHDANEFKQITSLFHLKIAIQDFIKPKAPVQCTRCQRLGHTRNFCNLNANCVKCGGPHLTSECKKTKEDEPICYNCKQKHTANYSGCSFFTVAKHALRNTNQPIPTPITNIPSQFPSLPTPSYSQITSQTPQQQTNTPTNSNNTNTNDLIQWTLNIINQV
ncbi:hypothetical protein J437_LFUL016537 [Ladona fulva]|uniref:Gag-like protein n=1 Tax=Ladona fulva TaxID=123851 RepID=A0A8K0KNG9_LADFU|nr:hypothetical protein J437_LFUL016537 [Ladona fulva]